MACIEIANVSCPNEGTVHKKYIVAVAPNWAQCMRCGTAFPWPIPGSERIFGMAFLDRKQCTVEKALEVEV